MDNKDLGIITLATMLSTGFSGSQTSNEVRERGPSWYRSALPTREPFDKAGLRARRKAERTRKRDQRRKNRR